MELNFEDLKVLKEKAKERKDGVYSFKCRTYVVKDKKLVAFFESNRSFFDVRFGFAVLIGKNIDNPKKCAENWLKEVK